jgi:hypothetical protein
MLKETFETLIESQHRIVGDFYASKVYNKSYRIAVDKNMNPALLIDESQYQDNNLLKSNYKLRHIEILYASSCDIVDKENNSKLNQQKFTIVKLVNFDSDLLDYFFLLMEHIVLKTKDNLKEKVVRIELDKLVDLFSKKVRIDLQTTLGLWGELFFISQSINKEQSIKDWHIESSNSLDFTHNDGSFTEVKTTLKGRREHTFSSRQLELFNKLPVTIFSCMTESTSHGHSIIDLVKLIELSLDSDNAKSKLLELVVKTMNSDVESINNIKFNFDFAESSQKLFDFKSFPIESIILPNYIIDARFTINFDDIY